MNATLTPLFIQEMTHDLRRYLGLCDEILNLATQENLALGGQSAYDPEFFQDQRRTLLPNLEQMLARLRSRRLVWQTSSRNERENCTEITPLFQQIQDQLMKVLLLDRENQQIMLRRGMVPPSHLPNPAPRPNYLASVYQRHAISAS